jgi:hypothetical protein
MAEADVAEKLILKPGAMTQYLSNFERSEDNESFFFKDFIL